MTTRRLLPNARAARALALVAAWSAAAALATPAAAQGRLRELACRGKAGGMDLRIDKDPSPRDARAVAVVLRYQRSTAVAGSEYANLEPGACTWNPWGWKDMPAEPGLVHFDVPREAQPWSATGTRQMDTTVKAGAYFPDLISLPRYLADPQHHWRFFVDDVSHVSTSFGAWRETARPTYVTVTGPVGASPAPDGPRDLRCRGGPVGLTFTRGTSAGTNLVNMTLAYRVGFDVPGPLGKGIEPGMCAWVDRAGIAQEPGRVTFTTPGNAQLKQIQSGSAVDRTPTAAERWPDASTIPAYMTDPSHFWTFTVMRSAPTAARTHAAWKPTVTDVATAKPSTVTSTVRTIPGATGTTTRDASTAGSKTSQAARAALAIRDVQVTPSLETAVIRFHAGPNLGPTVQISTSPPTGSPGSYRFAAPTTFAVGGTPSGTAWRYVAAYQTPLARNTRFWYIISANLGDGGPPDQRIGEFKTLGQRVTIAFSQIYVISDGDTGSGEDGRSGDEEGELAFDLMACPHGALTSAKVKDPMSYLAWKEGPHAVSARMTSTSDATPDRVRILVLGTDKDGYGVYDFPRLSCTSPGQDIPPGRNANWEWNSIARDIDLRAYPGAKAGDQFVWRSKPLANGSKLMFEVRGSILVTRQ